MNFVEIFPIAIATKTLESLTPDVIGRAIELIDKSSHLDMGSGGSFTSEQQFLDHPLFVEVKKEVVEVCKEFSRGYAHEVEDIGICNSWANVIAPGEGIPAHKHNNSYISGSFYLTHGSALSIANPNFLNLFSMMPGIRENNPRSWGAYQLKPEPGLVVVFPSGLYHGVSPSRAKENRYSVAFNAIPLGRIGIPTSFMNIRLGS